MDINLNTACVCKKNLYELKKKINMILPCQHMFHRDCLNALKPLKCPFCKINIENKISLNDVMKKKLNIQFYYDILSVTNIDNESNHNIFNFFDNIFDISSILYNIWTCNNKLNIKQTARDILSLSNTNVMISGLEKIKKGKKVFICNHTSYLDMVAIFSFISDTYFLASSVINDSIIGQKISNILPCVTIKRGRDSNTVDQLKKFVDKNGSICIFPEGTMTHPKTLARFRTGAFNIGYPIYPIVIRYENIQHDCSISNFILKVASRNRMCIYIDILDPRYPPFVSSDIENIRSEMALAGDLFLSRVSSRDIVDS
jgi:1-acyl-sn-glycerol-3-phosphate acyltransferase